MSKNNSQREIEEAHKKVRGEEKLSKEKKTGQKKDSLEKTDEVVSEKKEIEKILENKAQLSGSQLSEEEIQAELEQKQRKEIVDLEDIARKGAVLPAEAQDSQYVERLSHRPMKEIYNEIKDIYKIVEDKGYLSPTEQKQIEYLSSAVQRKFEDEEQGTYSFSEEAARAASITQQLSSTMMGSYKGRKMNEMYR